MKDEEITRQEALKKMGKYATFVECLRSNGVSRLYELGLER